MSLQRNATHRKAERDDKPYSGKNSSYKSSRGRGYGGYKNYNRYSYNSNRGNGQRGRRRGAWQQKGAYYGGAKKKKSFNRKKDNKSDG